MGTADDPRLQTVIEFYQTLTAESVAALGSVYAADATFKDPFNDVRGIDEIRRILQKMFDEVDDAKFEIREALVSGNSGFLIWDFTFRIRRWKPDILQRIHGATHLRFNVDGKIIAHRDYWDAAEELYEKLPIVGALMRWLRSKMA